MAAILAFLRGFASTTFLQVFISRILAGVGVAAVSYVGISALMSVAESKIASQFAGMGADLWTVLTIAKFPQACSIILSAVVGKFVLSGLTESGVLRRVTWTGTGPIVLN